MSDHTEDVALVLDASHIEAGDDPRVELLACRAKLAALTEHACITNDERSMFKHEAERCKADNERLQRVVEAADKMSDLFAPDTEYIAVSNYRTAREETP